jgi:hypothetical protein
MKGKLAILSVLTLVAFAAWSSTAAIAQQKTVKACQDEWRANKAAMQAAGTTLKAYVEKCRAGTAASTPATTSAPASSASAPTSQKTVKACREEWRGQKTAMQAAGKTEKAYVEECRGGTASARPASAPAAAPAPTATAPAQPAPSAARPAPSVAAAPAKTPATGTPSGAGQFATEAQAKSQCPADTVVWVNLNSKIYHFNGSKDYGNTKEGAYMCERNTASAGFRAAKNEKHP